MIREFPEDYELLSFFETEPTVLDRSAPWVYNTLEFAVSRGETTIAAKITGSYGKLDLFISSPETEQTHQLRNIAVLRVAKENSVEVLLAQFEEDRHMKEFRLVLSPKVRIYFAMGDRNLP